MIGPDEVADHDEPDLKYPISWVPMTGMDWAVVIFASVLTGCMLGTVIGVVLNWDTVIAGVQLCQRAW